MPGRSLYSHSMTRDQLAPHRNGAEDDLKTIKEVFSDDDDCLSSCCPTFTGRNSLDLGHQSVGVESLRAVDTSDLPPVLAVVVHEHVLADAQQGGGVHLQATRDRHLEPPHVTRVTSILQAVLVALQEKLQLKPKKTKIVKLFETVLERK